MSKRVLWIEDAGYDDLDTLASYVEIETEIVLRIATDASKAIHDLTKFEFDVVIVDLKIPPGSSKAWLDLFYEMGGDLKHSNLGLHLLQSVLAHPKAKVNLPTRPAWISPQKIGVLTIEPDWRDALGELGISKYVIKDRTLSESTLADLIKELLDSTDNRGAVSS